jgi:hypothetical protein
LNAKKSDETRSPGKRFSTTLMLLNTSIQRESVVNDGR